MWAVVNGRLVPLREARVSVEDRGFLYGDGAFETMRAYGGRVFRLERHLQRLRRTLGDMCIAWPSLDLRGAIETVLRSNDLLDAFVRLTVSRGQGAGLDVPAGATPTVVVTASPADRYPEELYRRGIAAASVRVARSPWLASRKTLSFVECVLARLEARRRGAEEAVLVTPEGQLLEAAAANLFLVRDGALFTPPPGSVLPGITREVVLELAPRLGMTVREEPLFLQDLARAQEALLTNSLWEVMPLVRVDGRQVGAGRPGPVAIALREAYRELVRSELGWNG